MDFALKIVPWADGRNIRLQLWDIAGAIILFKRRNIFFLLLKTGQERFSSMTRVYYKQATACVIIFDITRKSTFQVCAIILTFLVRVKMFVCNSKEVIKWKTDLDNKTRLPSGDRLPCLLVANKCDLPQRYSYLTKRKEHDVFYVTSFQTSDVGGNQSHVRKRRIHRLDWDICQGGCERYDIIKDNIHNVIISFSCKSDAVPYWAYSCTPWWSSCCPWSRPAGTPWKRTRQEGAKVLPVILPPIDHPIDPTLVFNSA